MGIGSDLYDQLPEALRWGLFEYYRVNVPDNLAVMLEAGRYFKAKYGQIDRVESHSEYWMPCEAALREDLDVWGPKVKDVEASQRKSMMKERFRAAGIQVARGQLASTIDLALQFADEVGFPLIAKPDRGVGAASTYRIVNREQLVDFYSGKAHQDCFLEEFIDGQIETFDGLADREGKIVYCNSLVYQTGIMDVVNDNTHIYYYTQRKLEPDLEAIGRRSVTAFQVREKFFHFEFFRRYSDKRLIALEANLRPPGGLSVDMWNYADDIDLYLAWARLVADGRCDIIYERARHVMFVCRKDNIHYRRTHEEVLQRFGVHSVHWERMSPIFRNALGDTGYLIRSESLNELVELARMCHEKA